MPPTWFHPASPKQKPVKPSKDVDTCSINTQSTFSSTVSLLKSKLPFSYKDYKARKEAEALEQKSLPDKERKPEKKSKRKGWPSETKNRESLPAPSDFIESLRRDFADVLWYSEVRDQ